MSAHALDLKGDAWRQLLNCAARPDDAHAGRGRCPWTPAYKQHLTSLPPLHSKELVVPPLARVLLFGSELPAATRPVLPPPSPHANAPYWQ
jgi:hypothetical protein